MSEQIMEVAATRDMAVANSFEVGDEVASGSMTGVILSIHGDEADISWSCRGKSSEKLRNLARFGKLAMSDAHN